MIHRPLFLLIALILALQDPAPTELIPSEAFLVAEAPDLSATVERLLETEAWQRFRKGPLGQEVFQNPQVAAGLFGLNSLASSANAEPLELLEALTAGGAAFSLLPGDSLDKPHGLLIFKAIDPDLAQDAINALLQFVGQDSKVSGDDWRMSVPDGIAARKGDLFMLASAAKVLDSLAPSRKQSVAALPAFDAGRKAAGKGELSVWVKSEVWKALQSMSGVDATKLPEIGSSYLLGHAHEVLNQADWVVGKFEVEPDHLALEFKANADAAALGESHAPFFPAARSVSLPQLPDHFASIVQLRDLGPWWTSRDLYITESGVAESVEGDGNFSLLFQRDFGPEVLHWLEPEVRVVSARVPFGQTKPEIEFPAAAMGVKLKPGHPEDLPTAFSSAFFALITFTNFDGDQMGDYSLQPDMQMLEDGSKLYQSSYRDLGENRLAPPRYNLSPAMLVRPDGEIWISSSTALAKTIATAPRRELQVDGDRFEFDLTPARALLAAGREALYSQQLVEQGGDEEKAEQNVKFIIAAAELFDYFNMSTGFDAGDFELRLEIGTQDQEEQEHGAR